jgi:hypothetical protein
MTEHADIIEQIDTVFSDMRKRNEVSIQPNAIGDKVAALLDPHCRATKLTAFASRMMCRNYARERLRSYMRGIQSSITQGAFDLEPYCPTGAGDEHVLRLEMTLDERWAFSASLGSEISTKRAHRKAFDAETRMLIRQKYFDERGRPKNSRRTFTEAA